MSLNPIHHWRQYRRLTRQERRLLWPALGYVLITRICLALLGLKRCLSLLDGRDANEGQGRNWEAQARAILRAGNRVPGARCLVRAIALRWWMRRSGEPAELAIGVKSAEAQRPDVHAWVENRGLTWDWPRDKPLAYRIISRDNRPVAGDQRQGRAAG